MVNLKRVMVLTMEILKIGMSDRFLQFKLFISSYIFIVLKAITAAS